MNDAINRAIRQARKLRVDDSDQLTLQELIDKIFPFRDRTESDDPDREPWTINFDFGSAKPTTLDSWRGDYAELALGYELSGYDRKSDDGHFAQMTVRDLYDHLVGCLGKSFQGWKGGYYTATEDTPVWVANPGNAGNTMIVDVIEGEGFNLVILTAYGIY
jgi:hypothetical protein